MILAQDIYLDPDMKSTRDGYGEALVELGKQNKDVVVLTADLAESTRVEDFSKEFPERFFECGVAEQNMIGVASGLALSGRTPFASSFAIFSPGQNLGQIRLSICYSGASVKIASTHGGLSAGQDGASHQALEDIAQMRTLSGMTVIVPCDFLEAKKATQAVAKRKGPVYLRFGRDKTPVVTTSSTDFEIGKIEVLKEGKDVTIVACGTLVYEALIAARELEKEHIFASVLNCHTIKPIDEKTLVEYAKKTGAVVTCEEHQVNGGLGSAVCEVLGEYYPVPVKRVGVEDRFGESGKADELMEKYGLTAKNICKKVRKVIKDKK
jgi:transketolase